MRFAIAASLAASLLLTGCQDKAPSAPVTVTESWIRLPAAPGRPGSAYFTVRSDGRPITLASVASPQIDRIELHESRVENGMMRMRPLAHIAVPEDQALVFEPGGKHAMLFGIDPSLKPGDRIKLHLKFEPSIEIVSDAEVRGLGGEEHAGH